MLKILLSIFLIETTASGVGSTPPDSTKNSFNLFHRTPKKMMRSFETDRPDATESAYTVDAGHFQLETDLFKTDRLSLDGIKTIQNSYNGFNLKLGITNSTDIQFIANMITHTKISKEKTRKNDQFFNDITIRIKRNIWGNDMDKTAMAILPFVNFNNGSIGEMTGGVILPFSIELPNDWGFGTQAEFDLEKNQINKGYHLNYLYSATIAHPLFRTLDFFSEGLISKESEMNSSEYFIDAGLVYSWKENIKLDSGIYYGLKNSSSKTYFIGISFRY